MTVDAMPDAMPDAKSLVLHAPRFAVEAAAAVARTCFGLDGILTALPSERDQNFLVSGPDGAQAVLKLANAQEARALLAAQHAALAWVNAHAARPLCPQPLAAPDGATLVEVTGPDGRSHWARALTWLPGTPLGTINPHTPALLHDLGRFLGTLDRALDGFDHPAFHRTFHWDVAHAKAVIDAHLDEIDHPQRRALVRRLADRFAANTLPTLPHLRHAVIHADANDYNLLVGGDGVPGAGPSDDLPARHQQVTGILDFGDMVYTCLAAEVAIGAAYALLDKDDPLAVVQEIVAGYHAVWPLREDEIAAVWDLVCMRLCMSVCHAAHQRRLQPGNEYLSISERPAWAALGRLDAVHPRLAHYALRAACGLPPVPQAATIAAYLARQAPTAAPVLDTDLRATGEAPPVHVLDLSISSPLLTAALLTTDDTRRLTQAINAEINEAGAQVGIGRYDEPRAIYTGPAFAVSASPTAERRTVHLGLDLFAAPGTPVYAPLAGTIAAWADNTARHDYGPVIVLAHATDAGVPFWTLYGHLTPDSLDGLTLGRPVAAGQCVGRIGAPPSNGDWPPHLHLQVITDLLELGTDFPGVAAPSRRAVYLGLSPDPNLLLGIPAQAFPPPPRDREATLAERKRRIGYNLSISYRKPLKIVRGLGVYLYDDAGTPYLDCVNNVAHVGHSHPYVVAAGQRQMAVLNTNTRYLHDNIIEYAERLCATLPEPLRVCYFVNSGSEANDLALRLARTATGAVDLLTLDVAYHGHTQALIEVSPYKHDGPGGQGRPPYVQKIVMPDPYRGPYRGYGADAGRRYGDHVRQAVEAVHGQGRSVAGIIAESLMGCGGQIVFPDAFMAEAFAHVRAAGGICIADEVQTGLARVGTHYWGFETQGVVPDIVTLGKPAGNGHPLAAVVTTPEIAAKFANGMEYFNTFGGNPVSCAIGVAVLDVIEREALQANALDVGNYLMDGARALMAEHPLIGDVRGLGLYIGIELVLDRDTRQPAAEQATYIANRMRDFGVLLSTDGPDHNVLKIKPPIVFSRANADHLLATLAVVLKEDAVQV